MRGMPTTRRPGRPGAARRKAAGPAVPVGTSVVYAATRAAPNATGRRRGRTATGLPRAGEAGTRAPAPITVYGLRACCYVSTVSVMRRGSRLVRAERASRAPAIATAGRPITGTPTTDPGVATGTVVAATAIGVDGGRVATAAASSRLAAGTAAGRPGTSTSSARPTVVRVAAVITTSRPASSRDGTEVVSVVLLRTPGRPAGRLATRTAGGTTDVPKGRRTVPRATPAAPSTILLVAAPVGSNREGRRGHTSIALDFMFVKSEMRVRNPMDSLSK